MPLQSIKLAVTLLRYSRLPYNILYLHNSSLRITEQDLKGKAKYFMRLWCKLIVVLEEVAAARRKQFLKRF